MKLINYKSYTADQLKSIKDNIDRILNEDNITNTPPPPITYIKVITNAEIANSLDKKEFMYNKIQDTFDQYDNWSKQSIDEIVELNSNSTSGAIAYSFSSSIYNNYDVDKASIYGPIRSYGGKNYHGVRPLFLFKE